MILTLRGCSVTFFVLVDILVRGVVKNQYNV